MNEQHANYVNTLDSRCTNLLFREKKAIAVLSKLCSLSNNKLDYFKATKFMYLFDRNKLLTTGEPAFYGRPCSLPLGPIISEVYDGLKSLKIDDSNLGIDWKEHFSLDRNKHLIHQVDQDTELFGGELSEDDVECLQNIYAKYEHDVENRQLKKDIAGLPEHVNLPEGKRYQPLSYAYILSKNGYSNSEIEDVFREIEYENLLSAVLELAK
ncbi:MAG: Panacea domain-containing protein [Anaerolineaceae bacterium]|nr:Panacea domain-containing protein [Anaerolineaceae bacterium]